MYFDVKIIYMSEQGENIFKTAQSQIKDSVAGDITNERKINPGEKIRISYTSGMPFVEFGGERKVDKKSKDPNTQIILNGVPDNGTRIQFYLGEEGVPVFYNSGSKTVEIAANRWGGQPKNDNYRSGTFSLEPGSWANCYPQGGSHYELRWPINEGKKVIIDFSGTEDTTTKEKGTISKFIIKQK